jgi:hypothetical protein
MRILVCAKNDLPANLACNRLCAELGDAELTFWLSDITRPAEQNDPDLRTMRFFERDLPNHWIYPLIDQAPAPLNGACLTFDQLAERYGTTLRVVPSLRNPEVASAMTLLKPDLVISIRFSHIFPENLIQIPRHGILNIPPGPLPEYAGLFAPFRQMLDGQNHMGCTVHWIDCGIDTGPVVSRQTLEISPKRSLIWHVCNIYLPGVDAVVNIANDLKHGRPPLAESQDPSNRHYHKLPTPTDFRQFHDRNLKLIDYSDYEDLLSHYRPLPEGVIGRLARSIEAPDSDISSRKSA